MAKFELDFAGDDGVIAGINEMKKIFENVEVLKVTNVAGMYPQVQISIDESEIARFADWYGCDVDDLMECAMQLRVRKVTASAVIFLLPPQPVLKLTFCETVYSKTFQEHRVYSRIFWLASGFTRKKLKTVKVQKKKVEEREWFIGKN